MKTVCAWKLPDADTYYNHAPEQLHDDGDGTAMSHEIGLKEVAPFQARIAGKT